MVSGALAQGPRLETSPARSGNSVLAVGAMPLDQLPPPVRDRVRAVVDQPTLAIQGPIESFNCQPAMYYWLLDHPDLAVRMWRSLGAKCADILSQGDGHFLWKDDQGSLIHWQTVLHGSRQRIWYAEGQVRPGLLLPKVAVKAVVVLNFSEGWDRMGHPALRHQMNLMLHTDSQAVALAARLLGASAPRLAEQYVAQMEMFFAALSWYIDQDPDRALRLFQEIKHPRAHPRESPAAPGSANE
jgi:hypothetical protein